jgi:type IV secretory pathway TrbL component
MSSVSPIVGIGSTYFGQFTNALQGQEPDIAQAMSLVLASLALLGLGIFGPTIASGLVAGAPQLGAGSVMATGALAAGGLAATAGAGIGAARGLAGAGLGAVRAGTSMGSATASAYHTGQQEAGQAPSAAGWAVSPMPRAAGWPELQQGKVRAPRAPPVMATPHPASRPVPRKVNPKQAGQRGCPR